MWKSGARIRQTKSVNPIAFPPPFHPKVFVFLKNKTTYQMAELDKYLSITREIFLSSVFAPPRECFLGDNVKYEKMIYMYRLQSQIADL